MFLLFIVDSDSNIIGELYFKNYNQMLYAANKILGIDNGEDAVQDVFAKLIAKKYGELSELRDKRVGYFVILVKWRSLDIKKKRKETVPLEFQNGAIFDNTENPEDILIDKDDKERLIQLLYILTPTMQEILEYRYVLELDNKEIAEMLGVSQSVVSSRIMRAKAELKKRLSEQKEGK